MKALGIIGVSLFVVAILGPVAPAAFAGAPYCATDEPISVLKCYSDACTARDSVAYAALLAPDYHGVNVSDSTVVGSDYQTAVTSMARMFRAPEVKRLVMQFGRPGAVEAGEVAGSWVIRNVPATLRVEAKTSDGQPGPFFVKAVMTYWVRSVADPTPHFVIYRDEQRNPDGQ